MVDRSALDRVREQCADDLARAVTERDLTALRDRYLGRKGGAVTRLLKDVAAAPAADRPALGRLANELKTDIEQQLAGRQQALAAARPRPGSIDVTLPGRETPLGHRHPLTLVREEIDAIFTRMGYEILEGPEVEDDYHNFEALNLPPDHPARDMQDTLYLARPIEITAVTGGESRQATATLLRTHTSALQIRYMETHAPPVRIIAPGKVFRRDNLDPSHTPMFHQVEGLVVDETITLADLKGTITGFLRELFGPTAAVRFRPSFFPYTEPSAEFDVGCVLCGGSGCPACGQTGWLEVMGSGMVHPAVFEAVGYDPERYTGFAFGMGVDRIAMLRYGVDDIRLLFENDLRFLEQFPY